MTASSVDKVICENYILVDWFPDKLQFVGTSYLEAATKECEQAHVTEQEICLTLMWK
jgi:hypothetical protein